MVFKIVQKYWRIFWQMQKINLMRRMAYPASFLINIGTVAMLMALSFLFINVTFGYIRNLAGWGYYQVLAAVGSYMIIDGIMWAFMSQLNPLNRHIAEGTLDGIMLKPVDTQFLVSFWKGDVEDLVRIFSGVAALAVAMSNTHVGLGNFLFFLLLLSGGYLILYSFNLIIRCFSFWIIDGSGLWILMERVTSNSQFPVDIYYHKIVRNVFTFVVPLAFIATFPAKILTSVTVDWKLIALSLVMVSLFFFGSRAFWKFSLKHYASASS